MFKYDIHTHTADSSRCGVVRASETVHRYKEAGYTGIIITDHFVNGSTRADKNASWKERIEVLTAGYRAAKEEGAGIGLDVFFGFEYPWWGMDYLTYGIDEQTLTDHPELEDIKIRDFFSFVHSNGGIVIQAHPMRERDYIKGIYLHTDFIDGVEVYNGSHHDNEKKGYSDSPEFDVRAKRYADDHPHLLQTAGSDTHSYLRGGCMLFDEKIRSVSDFISKLRAREYKLGE